MKHSLLYVCACLLLGTTASASLNIQTLRRQCYWSEKGGTVKYDILRESCNGDSCLYKKVADFDGSDFNHSEEGRGPYGTGRDPHPGGNYAGFYYSEKREDLRDRCGKSVERYCQHKSGKIETITTKLGTFAACLTEHEYVFDTLRLWSVPYLPFYSFLRMEYKGARYDLSSHPMFSDQLNRLPLVKVSGRCFEVLGKKYCEGGDAAASMVVMAGSMDRLDKIYGITDPGNYWIEEVNPEKVKFQKTDGISFKNIEINTQDLGMYLVQKKCVRGVCPGTQIRIEQPDNRSSFCQYSPNGSMNEFGKEFEFVGFLGSGNNYSEVWKVISGDSVYSSEPYESWPNSSDVLGRGGLGWNGSGLVKVIKK